VKKNVGIIRPLRDLPEADRRRETKRDCGPGAKEAPAKRNVPQKKKKPWKRPPQKHEGKSENSVWAQSGTNSPKQEVCKGDYIYREGGDPEGVVRRLSRSEASDSVDNII